MQHPIYQALSKGILVREALLMEMPYNLWIINIYMQMKLPNTQIKLLNVLIKLAKM